jgi:polyribonucleotide nucleotidyltransferase
MQKVVKEVELNGEKITLTTGHLAYKADSVIEAQIGETVVLAIVTVDDEDTTLDYFPLSVEYIEKFYAGGVISGSRFVKRERRPSDEAVLKARQVDHTIRSLFPKGFMKPVSVVITVMSYDEVHDPDDLSVIAASTALMNSSVPYEGPAASVKIAKSNEGEFIVNPKSDVEDLDSKFVFSIKNDRLLNIEGYGNELPEEEMDAMLDMAVETVQPVLKIQEEFRAEVGKEKIKVEDEAIPEEVLSKVKDYKEEIEKALFDKKNRDEIYSEVTSKIVEEGGGDISKSDARSAVEYIAKKIMRSNILEEEKRTSGRDLDEIRPLQIEVGVLPRVHGSALFSRGLTQTMTIVTLGSTRLSQQLESFEGEDEKRFMHHYNGPNYSFGSAGRFSYYPGRREIGHGHITESAFEKMLPSEEEFPYAIRVVSEIMSQNGSSSMAAATATSLALMHAGVPIKKPQAGIAVGLITKREDESEYTLLTDLEDVEDFYGDMDFKVVGTDKGITAIQMDNKIQGVPIDIIKAAFRQAKTGREFVLEQTNKVISEPAKDVSKYAPKVETMKIDKEKIGDLIGPGGKNIKSILEEAGDVEIDIQDSGDVTITAVGEEARQKAISLINQSVKGAEVGQVYEGVVDKVMNYGAFVDVSPAISGLVHISEMSDEYVEDPNEIVSKGDKVRVKVKGIDEQDRVQLTMKGVEQK